MRSKMLNFVKIFSVVSLFVVGAISGVFISYQFRDVPTEYVISEPQRNWQLFDGPIVGDESGFHYFMTYPHQADPGTAYATNLSNATAYEFTDYLNMEMTGETPWDQLWDGVLKFSVNDTVGYNTSGSKWEDSWVRANISIDFDFLGDVAETSMTIIQIANNTDRAWYHGYLNNAGSGYQITKNEKFNVTKLSGEGYWVV